MEQMFPGRSRHRAERQVKKMRILPRLVRYHLHVWGGISKQERATLSLQQEARLIGQARLPEQFFGYTKMVERRRHTQIISQMQSRKQTIM